MKWQPIETAPKSVADGRKVGGIYHLGFIPDDGSHDGQSQISVIWWEPLMKSRHGERGKWCADAFDCAVEVKPTHWMPLPEPPDDAN